MQFLVTEAERCVVDHTDARGVPSWKPMIQRIVQFFAGGILCLKKLNNFKAMTRNKRYERSCFSN
jgi:hypothetical protein